MSFAAAASADGLAAITVDTELKAKHTARFLPLNHKPVNAQISVKGMMAGTKAQFMILSTAPCAHPSGTLALARADIRTGRSGFCTAFFGEVSGEALLVFFFFLI